MSNIEEVNNNLNQILNEIEYYQMHISDILANNNINEKICDWYENNKEKYQKYNCALGHISSALVQRSHLLSYILFDESSDAKNIKQLFNRLCSTKYVKKNIHIKIKETVKNAEIQVENIKEDIYSLQKFRHNVYAHFNKNIFKNDWQENFKKENSFNFNNILNGLIEIYKCLNSIKILLGYQEMSLEYTNQNDIELLLSKL